MLISVVAEGDKRQQAIHLNMDSMRKFLASYEQVRSCEKKLVAEGYQEKYFIKNRKNYGQLIKLFAQRSEAAEFRRRTSLFENPEPRSESTTIIGKRVARKDKTTQTEKNETEDASKSICLADQKNE